MHVGSLAGGSSPVALSAAAAARMHAAVRLAGNSEACGLLFGDTVHVAEASVARNVAAEPWHRFEIDPAHLFDAHRRHRSGPPWLIGCWHSHPDGLPIPSRHDRAGVANESWLWLIIAQGAIRGWRPLPHPAGFAEVTLLPVAPGDPDL